MVGSREMVISARPDSASDDSTSLCNMFGPDLGV